jgi:hypothetical protein
MSSTGDREARGQRQRPSAPDDRRQVERRGPGRPKNGDTAVCPSCKTGTIEFSERYRWLNGPTAAWFCDSAACGYRRAVRACDVARLS